MKLKGLKFLVAIITVFLVNQVAFADTHYEVWRNTSNDSSTAARVANDVTGTNYDDTTVQPNQTNFYWIKVRTDVIASAAYFISNDLRYVTNAVSVPTSAKRGAYSEIITRTDFSGSPGSLVPSWSLRELDKSSDDEMTSWSNTVNVPNLGVTTVWSTNFVILSDWEKGVAAEVFGRIVVPTSLGGVQLDTPVVSCRLQAKWDSAPSGVQASDGTYTDRVRISWNTASGNSDFSTADSGIAICPLPGTPSGVDASDGIYCGSCRVTWNSVSGATAYDVYRDGNLVGSPSGTNYDDIVADTSSHSYTVKAKNSCGTSGISSSDSGYSFCPCNYSLNPTSTNISAVAFAGAFNLSVGSGCSWSATTNQPWIHTIDVGSGSGTVNYTVDANGSTSSRTGTITVGGQTFTINQNGSAANNGRIAFFTYKVSDPNLYGRVFDKCNPSNGLSGPEFKGQLIGGVSSNTLIPFGPEAPLISVNGGGWINAGVIPVPGEPGVPFFYALRIWDGSSFSNPATASGQSETVQVILGGITSDGGFFPAPQANGFHSFLVGPCTNQITITKYGYSGGMQISGIGSPDGAVWRCLSSTNPTLPTGSWTQAGSGTFSGGKFSFSDSSSGGRFYRLVTP